MGFLDRYRAAEFDEVKRVEHDLVEWLIPHLERTNPALVAIALARSLRVIIRKAPEDVQRQLIPVLERFIEGKTGPGDEGRIWHPGKKVH